LGLPAAIGVYARFFAIGDIDQLRKTALLVSEQTNTDLLTIMDMPELDLLWWAEGLIKLNNERKKDMDRRAKEARKGNKRSL